MLLLLSEHVPWTRTMSLAFCSVVLISWDFERKKNIKNVLIKTYKQAVYSRMLMQLFQVHDGEYLTWYICD